MDELNIPKRFQNCSLENYTPQDETQTRFHEHIIELVEADEILDGFYVWGATGVGKTHLMYALANELEKRGSVVFKELGEGDSLPEGINKHDFVFIDEFSPFKLEELEGLVLQRYDHCKPTFIASNYSTDDFKENFKACNF